MKPLLAKIKNKIGPALQHVASSASKHAEKLSPTRKKFVVIIFCILSSALAICIIAKTFSNTHRNVFFMRPTMMPLHLGKNIKSPQSFISDDAYQRIEQFKKYLDSISIADKKAFTQLINERPHLMDSIMQFEKLYRSQSKKQ